MKGDAPERIWANRTWTPGGFGVLSGTLDLEPSELAAQTEYRRADLPPTLAEAMAVPEVRALVTWAEAMCVFYHDDNSTHMQSLRTIMANLKGDTP